MRRPDTDSHGNPLASGRSGCTRNTTTTAAKSAMGAGQPDARSGGDGIAR